MNGMKIATRAAIASALAASLGSASAVDLIGFSATNFEVPVNAIVSLSVLLDGPAPTDLVVLLTAPSSVLILGGSSTTVPQGSSAASLSFMGTEPGQAFIAASLNSTTVFSNFTVSSAVPEVRTAGLFAAGLAVLGLLRRRAQR